MCIRFLHSHFSWLNHFCTLIDANAVYKEHIPRKSIDCFGAFVYSRHFWEIKVHLESSPSLWSSRYHLLSLLQQGIALRSPLQENPLLLHQIQINKPQTMDEIYKPEVLKDSTRIEIKPKWIRTYCLGGCCWLSVIMTFCCSSSLLWMT